MALLQKMGWRPGEGLGKNKEGTLEPLQLEIKMDKKGEQLHVDAVGGPGCHISFIYAGNDDTDLQHYCLSRII